MLKVIGFDSWVGGAHNFERLEKAFREKGFEFSLVHIGSWGGDTGRPQEEQIGCMNVRDVSFYNGKGFAKILEYEKPSAVIFLSTDTFAHRAFNRYCRHQHIPTVHLYHGLVSVQRVGGEAAYKVNLFAQLRFALSRIPKAMRYIWPTYGTSLLATGGTLKDWFRFLADIVMGAIGRFNQTSAADARTDVCCVYVQADVGHAVEKYGFAKQNVIAVGNPDLTRFGLTNDLIGSMQRASQEGGVDVMYIDTGLIYTGFVFESANEFIQHMVDTKNQLESQGKHLIFKPHPDHSRTNILSILADAGIDVCSNQDFVDRLRRCCASIVEPSSLSVVPALMGMPIFLAQYGKLNMQCYGEVLTSYPRAHFLRSVDMFNSLLTDEQRSENWGRTTDWIEQNAGPLPSEDMPYRVVSVVEAMVNGDILDLC